MHTYSDEQVKNIIISLENLTVRGINNCNLVSNISYIINNPDGKPEESKEDTQITRTSNIVNRE